MTSKQPVTNVGELRKSGIVKLREENMYSIWVKTACCNLNSGQLRKVADITDRYARSYLLFSSRQIPIIPHIHLKDIDAVREELSQVELELDRCGPTVRNINVCYNDAVCPEAVIDPISLAEKLENFFNIPMSHKVKFGVAGCRRDCIISRALNDISFIGVKRDGRVGYDVSVGGRLGLNPFLGARMAELLDEEECVRFLQNYYDLMNREGRGEERSADLISRLGFDRVREELTKNLREDTGYRAIPCETKPEGKASAILTLRATCGEVTAAQLRKIADVADEYAQGVVHFTVRGAPEIPGIDAARRESIRRELAQVGLALLDSGIDNLQSCFGYYCTENNVNPQALLRRIEAKVGEIGLDNRNIRLAASGCPNSCGIPNVSDIGFYGVVEPEIELEACTGCELCVPVCKKKAITVKERKAIIDEELCANCGACVLVCPFDAILAKQRGFAVLVGGQEGEDTRLGRLIDRFLSEDEALRVAEKCLSVLKERGSSAAVLIDEMGLEGFQNILVSG